MKTQTLITLACVWTALAFLVPAQPVFSQDDPARAQFGQTRFVIQISPDHPDGQYRVGEDAVFTIRVLDRGSDVAKGTVYVHLFGKGGVGHLSDHELPLAGKPVTVRGRLEQPGVLYAWATTTPDAPGRVRGDAGAAFDWPKIRSTNAAPADFRKFWDKQKALLAAVPVGAVVKLEPSRSPETNFDAYRVTLNNVDGAKVRAWLSKPKGAGKHPAYLKIPAGGVDGAKLDPKALYPGLGFMTMSVSWFDLPTDKPKEHYSKLDARDGDFYQCYLRHGVESREQFFYRRGILGMMRAIDYLTSREDWDGRTLIVDGGSSGGAGAIWVAGLDSRVTAALIGVPAFTEPYGHAMDEFLEGLANGRCSTAAVRRTFSYYNPVNFARFIQCPVLIQTGLRDGNVFGAIAMHNLIPGQEKKIMIGPKQGHELFPPDFKEAQRTFVKEQLARALPAGNSSPVKKP